MTARQGRWIVLGTVVLLSGLLGRSAWQNGEWIGFVVTEVQLLVAMGLCWWLLSPEGGRR